MSDKCDVGMIGMAVMGRNLALNIMDKGFRVAVHNRNPEPMRLAVDESGGNLVPSKGLDDFVAKIARPRRIMMMIKAGAPVDTVMDQLRPLLDPGDIVIDGGNSWYEDTQRREKICREAGLRFLGVGVSGGEDGARFGPSLMPGGDEDAYRELEPVFQAIAAKTEYGPCVAYCGPDGAGHFVKMVHNGIEYADMQFIAEAYDVLRRLGGFGATALAEVFGEWNKGPLESFLVEITSKILNVRDPEGEGALVDQVLDKAGQKGTGRWTAAVALDNAVPIPSISAAVDARVLSSMKADRIEASKVLSGPPAPEFDIDATALADQVHDALYAAKVTGYAQGMHLIAEVSRKNQWRVDLSEIARIWTGGCIIRARFLDTIMKAYERNGALPNLLLDDTLRDAVESRQLAWREVVCRALRAGIPVPAMAAALAYFDSYRTADLPQNLIQAQRDAFGAHTYQRKGHPDGPFVHSEWLD